MSVDVQSPKGRTFEDVSSELALNKTLSTDNILFYCSLYAKADELARKKNEMSLLVKDALLRDSDVRRGETMEVAPKTCPYMLSVTRTDPKPTSFTDWEEVAKALGEKLLGGEFADEKRWKTVVSKFTKTNTAESQLRLNAPAINPDYEKL